MREAFFKRGESHPKLWGQSFQVGSSDGNPQGGSNKSTTPLHLQEGTTPSSATPFSSGRPFNDPVDATILRIGTKHKDITAKGSLEELLSTPFSEVNIENDKYKLQSLDAGLTFDIREQKDFGHAG